MNLLEHYIIEVHSVTDCTEEFEKHAGYKPEEPFLIVDLTYDCYGQKERKTVSFFQSAFEEAKRKGYYMA